MTNNKCLQLVLSCCFTLSDSRQGHRSTQFCSTLTCTAGNTPCSKQYTDYYITLLKMTQVYCAVTNLVQLEEGAQTRALCCQLACTPTRVDQPVHRNTLLHRRGYAISNLVVTESMQPCGHRVHATMYHMSTSPRGIAAAAVICCCCRPLRVQTAHHQLPLTPPTAAGLCSWGMWLLCTVT